MGNYLLPFIAWVSCLLMGPKVEKPYLSVGKSTIEIKQGDILNSDADIIVNAANSSLKMGAGICGAIFKAADPIALDQACQNVLQRLGKQQLAEAEVVETSACDLFGFFRGFKKIFHVVPPNFNAKNIIQPSRPFDQEGENLYKQCYENILKTLDDSGFRSIAIPFLSSGAFCQDQKDRPRLMELTLDSIIEYCQKSKKKKNIKLVLFSENDHTLFSEYAHSNYAGEIVE